LKSQGLDRRKLIKELNVNVKKCIVVNVWVETVRTIIVQHILMKPNQLGLKEIKDNLYLDSGKIPATGEHCDWCAYWNARNELEK
jgi:hypothetical protein